MRDVFCPISPLRTIRHDFHAANAAFSSGGAAETLMQQRMDEQKCKARLDIAPKWGMMRV
jgi:hypothetical protein